MKYYSLDISIDSDWETYHKVSDLLKVMPSENSNDFSLWFYQMESSDESNYDFINNFLDIIVPNFDALKELGIDKTDITFWLVYEYKHQCTFEFTPQEMKRLGENGIRLCIDCITK